MQRRHFLQAASAAAVAGPIAANAQAKPVRLALSWINNVEYAGFWMAL